VSVQIVFGLVTTGAANAGKNFGRPQHPTAPKPQVSAAANAAINKPPFQFQQQPLAPANLTQFLFGNAYPFGRALIYKNRQ
jgi:hypothetical protein